MKHWLRFSVVCLLVGAFAQVVISWALALFAFPDQTGGTNVMIGRTEWNCRIGRSIGCERVTTVPFEVSRDTSSPIPSYVELPDLWIRESAAGGVINVQTAYVATGWPWPGLLGTARTELSGPWLHDSDPGYPPPTARSSVIIGKGPLGMLQARMLPLQPLWPWFALNIFVTSSVVALCVLAASSLRRSYRQRHGLCLRCGYSVRGTHACPECGLSTQGNAA